MVAANMKEPHHNNEHGGNSSSSEGEEEMKTKTTTSYTSIDTANVNVNETTIFTSSMTTETHEDGNSCDERRFVWFQKEEEQKLRAEATGTRQFEYTGTAFGSNSLPASSRLDSKDFKDKVRAGAGAKGKTGSTDFTRGKNAFVRPCTVGWKSQNQPLMKGGGNRTPRQKG